MAAGEARPGREVVAEEERYREDVDSAQCEGGVLVRQPRARSPRPPRRLGVHPVDGDCGGGGGAELAGGERPDEEDEGAEAVGSELRLDPVRFRAKKK